MTLFPMLLFHPDSPPLTIKKVIITPLIFTALFWVTATVIGPWMSDIAGPSLELSSNWLEVPSRGSAVFNPRSLFPPPKQSSSRPATPEDSSSTSGQYWTIYNSHNWLLPYSTKTTVELCCYPRHRNQHATPDTSTSDNLRS